MLSEAIAAARAGDRVLARDLLSRLLRADTTNAEVWLWMSSVVDSTRERIYCLESALRLDPTHRAALRGLVVLGARPPAEPEKAPPLRPARRATPAYATVARPTPVSLNWALLGASAAGLLLFCGAATVLIQLIRPLALTLAPTLEPVSPTPAPPEATSLPPPATPLPVETRILRTPVPTELAGTPLAFFVPATPTATAMIGITPRPAYEAYSAGLAAMQRGEAEQALEFFDQMVQLQPDLADVHYFRGEALRSLGRTAEAIAEYDRAVLLDPAYAPAYLGRGRALLQIRPADLPADFDRALAADPLLADAYLAKAEYYARNRLWKTMEESMQAALAAGIGEPRVYLALSEAQLNRERYGDALENAIVGSANDPTRLDGYLAVGSAYVELEQHVQGLWPLQTYVVFAPEDHRGWGYLGRAQLGAGQIQEARFSLDMSLAINNRYAPAYLGRGYVHLRLGDGQAALNDFLQARRFGRESFPLELGLARAWFLVGEYRDALVSANAAIEASPSDRLRAEAYAVRGLIQEATTPPQLEDAVFSWRLLLALPDAAPETRALAESHLFALTGEGPTPTPPLGATPLPPGTEITPTPIPTATPTPIPTPTPTPRPPGVEPI